MFAPEPELWLCEAPETLEPPVTPEVPVALVVTPLRLETLLEPLLTFPEMLEALPELLEAPLETPFDEPPVRLEELVEEEDLAVVAP
mgnify:FL=1